jgi:hypothetical protein
MTAKQYRRSGCSGGATTAVGIERLRHSRGKAVAISRRSEAIVTRTADGLSRRKRSPADCRESLAEAEGSSHDCALDARGESACARAAYRMLHRHVNSFVLLDKLSLFLTVIRI